MKYDNMAVWKEKRKIGAKHPHRGDGEMTRVVAYIDGYNLYCSVRKQWAYDNSKSKLLFYDLRKLVNHYLSDTEELKDIRFYTAPPDPSDDRFNREDYDIWTTRQREKGIEVIEGIYYNRIRYFEEKQTDVNIAVDMVSGAFEDSYDKAVLISNDTDFYPAIAKCLVLEKAVLLLTTESVNKGKFSSLQKNYRDNCTFNTIGKKDIEKHLDKKLVRRKTAP